jgi:hypothetical protein
MLLKTYSACHVIQLTVTCNSTERTGAFPLQNGYVNASQCYVIRTIPLLLIDITANKNHTTIYVCIHVLKYYSYSANSCTLLTRASIGVISNSQHKFCSMWHAEEHNQRLNMREDSYIHCYSIHRLVHRTKLKYAHAILSEFTNCFADCLLIYTWYQLLRLCNVQWRSKVIWRPGRGNTWVAPNRNNEL